MAPKKEAVGESADDLAAEVFRKNDLLDVRESAFAAEHFQLGLKYIFTKQSGEHVEAPQEERSIAQLLVNCVSRVVAVNKVNRLQEGLQALLSEFMKRKKSSDGMTCEGQPRFLSDYTQCHQYVAQEKEGLRKAMQGWPSEKRAPSCSPMRKLALAGNYEKLCHEEPGVPWSGGLPVFSKGTRSQRVRRRAKNRVVAEDEVRLRPSTTWTKAAEMASSLAKDFLIQQSSSMAGFFLDARFFSRSPETNLVVCNFDLYEERRIALFIFLLAAQEPGENMTGCSYVEDEIFGTEIVFVVPASWLTQMPSVGTFRVRYRVDEKSVNLTQRLNLAKQILGWT
eukprot:GEMP01050905.1.p1 GENE.GEMP01050905.1~~GEMP01050905.1.p1  ORF type:complete len:338 (+),score=61.19 GEMP01050905.1:127-1140(+)